MRIQIDLGRRKRETAKIDRRAIQSSVCTLLMLTSLPVFSQAFVKHGDNGTATVDVYCSGAQWGTVGYSSSASITNLPASLYPGINPYGQSELTCTCSNASGQFIKHGDNGTASCDTFCAGAEWGTVGTGVSGSIGSVPTDYLPGLLPSGAELTAVCKGPNASALGNSSITSLGYYATEWYPSYPDYLSSTSAANIVDYTDTVSINSDQPGEAATLLKEANEKGLKAVVVVEHQLFGDASSNIPTPPNCPIINPVLTGSSPTPSPYNASCFGTWYYNFSISAGNATSAIAGFMIYDEPFLNNNCPTGCIFPPPAPTTTYLPSGCPVATIPDCGGNLSKVSPAQLYQNLVQSISTVNSIAPGIPTIINFSYPELHPDIYPIPGMSVPPNVSIVSFDCYANDPSCTDAMITDTFNRLVAAAPNQQLMTIPDAWWNTTPTTATILTDETALLDRIRYWQKQMATSSKVAFVTPFAYPNGITTGSIGAVDESVLDSSGNNYLMADVRTAWAAYWQGLKGTLVCDVNTAVNPTTGANWLYDGSQESWMCEPRCSGTNLVRVNILGQQTDSWVNAPMCTAQQQIVSEYAGQCLQGTQLTTCNAANTSQQWNITQVSGTQYTITNQGTGQCLAVLNGSTSVNAQVVESSCNGTAPQIWTLQELGINVYAFINLNSGLILDAGVHAAGPLDQTWLVSGSQFQSLWGLRSQYQEPY